MSESLAAINIEQLSNAVNNAVNAVALPSISPAPTSSCTTGGPTGGIQVSNITTMPVSVGGVQSTTVPLMLSLNLGDRTQLITLPDRTMPDRTVQHNGLQDRLIPIQPDNRNQVSFVDPTRLTSFTGSPFMFPLTQLISHDKGNTAAPVPNVGRVLDLSGATISSIAQSLQAPGDTITLPAGVQLPVIQSMQSVPTSNQQTMQTVLQTSQLVPPTAPEIATVVAQVDNMQHIQQQPLQQQPLTVTNLNTSLPAVPQTLQTNMTLPVTTTSHSSLPSMQFVTAPASLPAAPSANVPISIFNQGCYNSVANQAIPMEKENHNSLSDATFATQPQSLATSEARIIKLHDTSVQDESTKTTERDEDEILIDPSAADSIYCVHCDLITKGPCPIHSNSQVFVIEDTPILSRARMTTPPQLYLSPLHPNTDTKTAVHARVKIAAHTRIGCLEGESIAVDSCSDVSKVWKIFVEDECSKCIKNDDEDVCNWTMFMKKARSSMEQNVIAYQQQTDILFITCKTIESGKELLYWYSKGYAKLIGAPVKPEDSFKCKICVKVFPDTISMLKHQKLKHPDLTRRKFKCQFCSRAFTSATKRHIHFLGHMGLRPHKCPHCQKQFSDPSNLRTHLLIHSSEKKFTCEECDKTFRQKAHLESHKWVHTEKKSLQCQFCESHFKRPADLKIHQYQHTREIEYPCEQCNKVFYRKQNFAKHMKIHNGVRDFVCSSCEKSFVTKYHLARHKKTCKVLKGWVKDEDAQQREPPLEDSQEEQMNNFQQ